MSLDRFKHYHAEAYNYYCSKFTSKLDNSLKTMRRDLMKTQTPGFLPILNELAPLADQINELERITNSSKPPQIVLQREYVSKLAELKGKYQTNMPTFQTPTTPPIKLLSETDIDTKFKTLIELKQLKR